MAGVLVFLFKPSIYAQAYADQEEHLFELSIREIALLSLSPQQSTLFFELTFPEKAGEDPEFKSGPNNQQLWIHYTNGNALANETRNIGVQWGSGKLPAGVELYISAGGYTGNGKGKTGVTAGKVKITSSNTNLITGIGGAFTGRGAGNGHKLDYEVKISDAGALQNQNDQEINIVFTLSDN